MHPLFRPETEVVRHSHGSTNAGLAGTSSAVVRIPEEIAEEVATRRISCALRGDHSLPLRGNHNSHLP